MIISYNNPKNPIKRFERSDASHLCGIILVVTISNKNIINRHGGKNMISSIVR